MLNKVLSFGMSAMTAILFMGILSADVHADAPANTQTFKGTISDVVIKPNGNVDTFKVTETDENGDETTTTIVNKNDNDTVEGAIIRAGESGTTVLEFDADEAGARVTVRL